MTLADFLLDRIAEDEGDFSAHGADRGWPLPFVNRMLAECAAKRGIVEKVTWVHKGTRYIHEPYDTVLELLALPYADHPDYNPDWRP